MTDFSKIPFVHVLNELWLSQPDSQYPLHSKGFVRLAQRHPILRHLEKNVCALHSTDSDGETNFIGSAIFSMKGLFLTAHQILEQDGTINKRLRIYFSGNSNAFFNNNARTLWHNCASDVASVHITKADAWIKQSQMEPVRWHEGERYEGNVFFLGFLGKPLRIHASEGTISEWPDLPLEKNDKISASGYVRDGTSGGGVYTRDGKCLGIVDSGNFVEVDFTPSRTIFASAYDALHP